MTEADYERMFAEQEGRCAICRLPQRDHKHWQRLHIDHDHVTGRVRGLLCTHCNTALGKFADDPERLQRAIEYLAA